VVEAAGAPGAQHAGAFLFLELAVHGELADVEFDGDVVLLHSGQVDPHDVGVVGLLRVGRRCPSLTEQSAARDGRLPQPAHPLVQAVELADGPRAAPVCSRRTGSVISGHPSRKAPRPVAGHGRLAFRKSP
jgi:hypothetical protein